MTSVIAYVDGFNLYHGLRDKYRHRYLWLDLERLVRRLRPFDQIVAVRYFTAMVRNDPAALARQEAYLDALSAQSPGVIDIVMGRYQEKVGSCRQCGSRWRMYEEKETDVNIAVAMTTDAARRASDLALIVSADSDMCPAIRGSRSLAPERGVIVAFPPMRTSGEVRTLVPGAFTIGEAHLRNSQLPPTVRAPSGHELVRPAKWR
jgi:uncharacterized LabA/DUF88 family protein